MSDSVRPHRWQPTRLPRPWDSPGRNIGVGCHFLLQCMKVRSESEVAQSCPTLRNPMNHSLLGFSIHGIFQARVLKWVANYFSKYRIWGYIKPFEDRFSPNNFSILILPITWLTWTLASKSYSTEKRKVLTSLPCSWPSLGIFFTFLLSSWTF